MFKGVLSYLWGHRSASQGFIADIRKVSEYDQEIPQTHNADQPTAS